MEIYRRLSEYRDLLLVFVWREFSVRYRQTIIGVLWAVLQPLSMMLLFTFVFTYVLPTRVSDHPYPLFFYGGLLPWSFFASSLNYAVPSLSNHYNLVTKIYFPREIIPLAGVGVALVDFACAAAVYLLLLWGFGHPLTAQALWFVPLFALLFVFTCGVALVLAALNVYYRDVRLATGFLVQLWFFATPVFYSIDRLPLKLKLLLFLNPLTFIVENMRRCLLEGRGVVAWQFLTVGALVLLAFGLGYRLFLATERRFADVI